MRLHLTTTPNTEVVPFEYQQKMVGTLHKWLGNANKEHGFLSLYSFSWLQNGKKCSGGINFERGAKWFISFYDENRIKKIMQSILDNPYMFCGLKVIDIIIEETPDLADRELFYVASPVFIQRKIEGVEHDKYYFFYDQIASELMRETLLHKMSVSGLEADESLEIAFDLSYSQKKEKIMYYRGVGNKASLCPVFIKGKPETKAFAWNVGIGNSTGIGFGSIY